MLRAERKIMRWQWAREKLSVNNNNMNALMIIFGYIQRAALKGTHGVDAQAYTFCQVTLEDNNSTCHSSHQPQTLFTLPKNDSSPFL